MLDHMILTVSDIECSLAFYETVLKPPISNSSYPIKAKAATLICGGLVMARGRSFGSSNASLIQCPFTGGSRLKAMTKW